MPKSKLIKICFTGDIATGKSLVVREISKHFRIPCISVDKLVHQMYCVDKKGYIAYKNKYGKKYLLKNEVNRKLILSDLLNGKLKISKINHLVEPLIIESLKNEYRKYKNEKVLLIEMGIFKNCVNAYKELFDYVILLKASKKTKKQRICKKKDLSTKDATDIFNLFSCPKKQKFADKTVTNNRNIQKCLLKIHPFIERILND